MRQNSYNASRTERLQFFLLVAGSGVAMVGMVVSLPTNTVQADAVLSRPTAASLQSAASVKGATPQQLAMFQSPTRMLRGVASWYGEAFNGRLTASGEPFDMYAMTACHPTLPFGSVVRVTNLRNRRSVEVRITDRGYLANGRILDLSYGAAEKLDMLQSGVARVSIQVLSLGHPHDQSTNQ
jgi:rare lipoprotein A